VVFSETWIAGYPYWTEGWDSALTEWAGTRLLFTDQSILVPSEASEEIGRAAREANIYVAIGCNEMDPRPEVNTIYNSLLLFGRDGSLLGRHRKLMPTFTERLFWGHGDASDIAVFDTDIGRIGMLICGENLMTPVRAAIASMGEDIHIAVFPGAFALHTGPRLEEWNNSGDFWGHFVTRAHSIEAGCFTACACTYLSPDDVPADFTYRDRMNIGDLEVDERVRPGVTLVFGEEQFHRAAFDGYKGRESGLESMHGRFAESKSLVPGHGSRRILNAQYRDHFLFHVGSMAIATHSSCIRCQCTSFKEFSRLGTMRTTGPFQNTEAGASCQCAPAGNKIASSQ